MSHLIAALLKIINKQQFLIAFAVIGIVAYFLQVALDSEIQAFPEFTNVQVKVITLYPGKPGEEVERFVTRPLESVTSGLPGLIGSRSISLFGLSAITLTFDDNMPSSQARLNTQQRLRDAGLPAGVEAELEPDASPLGEIFRYVLTGPLPVDELRMIQDWTMERELKSVPGIADVVSFGGPTRTVDIRLDAKKIWDFNLNVDDIGERLSKNNLNAGGGFLERGQEAYLVRALGHYDSVESLANASVASRGGAPIRVKDVGHVEIGHKPRLGQVGFNDLDDVVEGIVLMRRGEDAMRTLERVKETIEKLNGSLPAGVKIRPTYDRSELIKRCSGTVIHNIVFGMGLVILILMLSFGTSNWPLILAVILIIPTSLLTAVFGVIKMGFTPNLISLGAVDFGIIVETAILASEALIAGLAVRKMKDDRGVANILGGVFGPSLICALVLIVAFIPILSLQRVEGRIFRPLGITLVSAVIGGQIGALLFVPWFSRWLKAGDHHKTLFHRFSDWVTGYVLIASRKLQRRLPLPRLVIGGVLMSIVVILFMSVGKEFLPDLNEGSIWIRAKAPNTISLAESAKIATEVRKRLREIPEVTHVISQAGRPDDGTDSAGFDNVEFSVGLLPVEQWTSAHTLPKMIAIAQDKLKGIEGVSFGFSQYLKDNIDEAVSGVKGELAFKIFGPDIHVLQTKSQEASRIIRAVPGADDVAAQMLLGQPEFRVTLDHQALASLSVDVSAVAQLVESAMSGREAGQMLDKQNRVSSIYVYPHSDTNLSMTELMRLPIATTAGARVTLDDVANLDTVEGVARVFRENGERRAAITVAVRGRDVVSFVQEATAKLKENLKLEPGYHFRWDGSFQSASRAAQQLMIVIPLCFFAILLILRSWFGTWSNPFQLLWQIPFSLTGALLAIKILGLNMSISAAAGGIVLCGVAFLTGMMILTEFAATGSGFTAVKNRSFGIVVSNAVAIFGLVPAAISTGVGAEISRPFAVMIVGGLSTSLLFSLLLYPIILGTVKTKE